MVGGNKRMRNNVIPHKFIEQSKSLSMGDGSRENPQASSMKVDKVGTEAMDLNIAKLRLDQNLGGIMDDLHSDLSNFNTPEDFQKNKSNVCDDPPATGGQKLHVGVQVKIRSSYRSVKVQCKPVTKDRSSSPIEQLVDDINAHNFISQPANNDQLLNPSPNTTNLSSNTTASSFPTSSDNFLTSNGSTENEWKNAFQQEEFQKRNLKQTFERIRLSPRKYIGIPSDCMDIIDILRMANLSDIDIFITLKKIRLNESFAILADDFGISTSNISRIFTKTLPVMAEYLKDFIIWPSSARIKLQLPISFRSRYAAVESIIDYLEIEIEKSTDPVKQSLTWSEYKCNTVKYLISCTPDGIVNFISPGFGGRTSDAEIVSQSGYLDCLKPGAAILADRGFKHIENFVVEKKCTLIRPPTVSSEKQPSHDEVLATKRIASLRIHIERLIRRIREFEICEPHSCVNIKLISQMDNIMIIAAALTNLQGPLIKKT
ncbi:LOW QUALITY PROTEIN: uncharacterized protein LOC141525457 [Cotesia typhae]|uniref:LOW QUALITY PROTEIN: uncharacterized protein LOC141525457 n=1 Tax=Cotesia typhae TaxID=2053667 RepID=UPI003D68C139